MAIPKSRSLASEAANFFLSSWICFDWSVGDCFEDEAVCEGESIIETMNKSMERLPPSSTLRIPLVYE
jgi:hypothetical protein